MGQFDSNRCSPLSKIPNPVFTGWRRFEGSVLMALRLLVVSTGSEVSLYCPTFKKSLRLASICEIFLHLLFLTWLFNSKHSFHIYPPFIISIHIFISLLWPCKVLVNSLGQTAATSAVAPGFMPTACIDLFVTPSLWMDTLLVWI